MEKEFPGEEEFAEMSFYQLEDVLFGLEVGSDGCCVQALSRCEYKGTESLTMDEEYHLMKKQVEETEGFDMDFSQFRYAFNYKPVDFDSNKLVMDGETVRELLDRLSRKSLEIYNKETKTSYGFVEVIKANYHMAGAGVMFFTTFLAKEEDSDDEPKTFFQAKVHYSVVDDNKYLSCDLKPPPPPPTKNVHSIDTADKEDAKKPRLTQEKDASQQWYTTLVI
ncbi:hypothetical protein HA466_0185540 [Hirschfeldia incana]|nr:hypothetical protein HA466_0185540 [Hirschfeldia incana]